MSFLFLQGDRYSSHSKDLLRSFAYFTKVMEDRVSISLHILDFNREYSGLPQISQYQNITALKIARETCLVHSYFYRDGDFTDTEMRLALIQLHMQSLMQKGMWAHHTVLVGSLAKNPSKQTRDQEMFHHSHAIANMHLRGAIIFINHRSLEISLLCVPCFPQMSQVFHLIRIIHKTTLKELVETSLRLNSDLQDAVVTSKAYITNKLEKFCSPLFSFSMWHMSGFSFDRTPCIFYILRLKHNFTFEPESTGFEIFTAREIDITQNKDNAGSYEESGIEQWSPFFASYIPLVLTSYQEKPHVIAEILIKPFGIESWLIIFLMATILTVLTISVERIKKSEIKVGHVILDMISSVLDQPMISNMQSIINSKARNLLPPWIKLWMLMVIVLGNSYKGMIYSYITNGMPIKWPSNLKEVLDDKKYLKVSTDIGVTDEDLFCFVRETLPTNKTSLLIKTSELATLRELRKQLRCHPSQILYEYFLERDLQLLRGEFKIPIGRQRTSRVALINFEWENVHLQFMTLFAQWIQSSDPVIIPSIVMPRLWTLFRNFFTNQFDRGLGQMAQFGFEKIYDKHFVKFHMCHIIEQRMWNIWLNLRSGIHKSKAAGEITGMEYKKFKSKLRSPLQKCGIVMRTGVNFNSLDSHPKPLSWRQLKAIFYLFSVISSVPVAAFLMEILKGLLKPRVAYWISTRRSDWMLLNPQKSILCCFTNNLENIQGRNIGLRIRVKSCEAEVK